MNPMEIDELIDSYGFGKTQMRIIFATGIIQAADAMEITLLSVLGPVLQCQWQITSSQAALLTTAVFAGMLLGAPLFGLLSDKYGRKTVLFITAINFGYFGLLGAMSRDFTFLVILRAIVGLFMGGVMSSTSSLTSETMPRSYRATAFALVLSFWGIGSLLECVLAYLILPSLGWRWLMVFTAIPPFCGIVALLFTPESPRYLLLSGQKDKAMEVLQGMAPQNDTTPILLKPIESTSLANALEMFHKNYRRTTILLFFIWLSCGFTYYGLILIIPILPSHPHKCLQDSNRISTVFNSGDVSCCEELSNETYLTMITSTTGELVGVFIALLCVELIGRKMSLIVLNLILSAMFPLLGLCVNTLTLNILLVMIRMTIFIFYSIVFVYTAEVFPTSIRSLSVGFCSVFARVGAMLTPFIAQVILREYSTLVSLFIYGGISLLAAVAAIFLPIETKNRALFETVEESKSINKSKLQYATQ